ncbi:MAG: cytochrome c3 family protein [Burkholderiales bacterium]|nr:cytochrome c3 family protein [Burkholderiales bacterium]
MNFDSNWPERCRRFARSWIAASIGTCFLCAATLLHAADDRVSAHPSMSDCGACHLAGQDVDQADAAKLSASQEMLCASCHERTLEIGHPSGFTPARQLPAEYPLDWKGNMTCSTCHAPHGRTSGLLRGTRRGREFCQACHDPAFFARMKDAGTSIVASGHLDIGTGTIDIDRHSLYCLGCHSGAFSGYAAVSVGRAGVLRHSGGIAPHPIGRSYGNASRNGSFRPQNQLAQRNIKLSDGRISCISCHQAYGREHGRLIATTDRSALCLSCHAR